jgi:hypothetical protein
MPAALVPHADIPILAARITPEMLRVLRHIQKADFIMNSEGVDSATLDVLRQLTGLGLVDAGYEGDPSGPPYMWVANGNGSRVLAYRTGIRGGPHYELPAAELAAWLEQQGTDRWWIVDGDPLLTGRLAFPCLAQKLAAEIRKIDRPLLVQARKEDTAANGQVIDRSKLDAAAGRIASNIHRIRGGERPDCSEDRILDLCWKGSTDEWLLIEDSDTTALMEAQEEGHGTDAARVEKH